MEQKMRSIRHQLDQLGCPFLESPSEQTLAELLLHPSEKRIKLLSWVIITFDSELEDLVNGVVPTMCGIDSRHKKILLALNIMGVCKDDLEMISGTAAQKKTNGFLANLNRLALYLPKGTAICG